MTLKKRYVQVGLGSHSQMYSTALTEGFSSSSELVALCDTNGGRLQQRAAWALEHGVTVKTYDAGDFERMIAECKPDCVIVATPCATHPAYICRAMELDNDVAKDLWGQESTS